MRIGVLLLALASPVLAGPHDFVVQHAGAGGDAQAAQGFIDQFLRFAEHQLKWAANSAQGQFSPNQEGAVQYIEQQKPGFGILDVPVFLDLRTKYDLIPMASVEGTNQLSGHLSVVVKDPKLKSLDDLKGKKLATTFDDRFVKTIVLNGKVIEGLGMVKTTTAFKTLKAVKNDEADAALVDDTQKARMKEIDPGLRVIYTSPVLPKTPVVAFGKNTTPADRDALVKMLLKMCGDAQGKDVCGALQITKFTPPDKAAYDDAIRKYK